MALVQAGAGVNVAGRGAKATLHHAASKCMHECVECLLRHNVSVNAEDADGNTALMYAVVKNRHQIVRSLLRSGGNVRRLGHCWFDGHTRRCTPLEAALHLGHVDAATLLYTAGASLDAFQHCQGECHVIDSQPTVVRWMQITKAQVRPLADICRLSIRDVCSGTMSISEAISKLSLPEKLHLFLAFQDV